MTTPKEFVSQLRATVIDENVAIYRDLFVGTSVESASDLYWRRALIMFKSLSPEQQKVFFDVVRQVAVDTTSNILGIIDGVSSLGNMKEKLALVSSQEPSILSGDLQDFFLAEESSMT
jgi:hypothetical protein